MPSCSAGHPVRIIHTNMLFVYSSALAADACLAFGAAETSVVVEDMPVVESSGVAASRAEDGMFYTLGDNGDEAKLHLFRTDGSYVGEQVVRGAVNEDWEDLANGPCLDGVGDCLWIADSGDNDDAREVVQVYVVPATLDAAVDATVCAFAYPDEPSNAEALLVFPDGSMSLVTKHTDGTAGIYGTAHPRCDGSVEILTQQAEVVLDAAVTGGAVSEDGQSVILRTYRGAWLWQGCALDWTGAPAAVDLGSESQGEAVTFTNTGALLTTSEGVPFRARTIPCAEMGVVPCEGCGCGSEKAGVWLVLPVLYGLRRRA